LLSLCLGLFLADAVASLADDSLILFFGTHLFSVVREVISTVAALMAVGVYCLIGLTPMVPKRLFLPIPLFNLVAVLAVFPFAIYCFDRIQQVAWGISFCQVILALGILYGSQGGFKFCWPLLSEGQLGIRRFSWRNLSVFVLVNVFVLLPAVIVYAFLCTAVAVDHFSDGFMALHPGGLTVQVRKYVRNDGKTIELFPMSHVADAGFYQKVSQTFPTNSIILMEGVTDTQNLLTNKISYKRMAKALGLAEQKEKFVPVRGEIVPADVDVDEFSNNTIDFLNLIMLIHSRGVNAGNLQKLMLYSPPPDFEEQLFDDLLRKRNQHLLEEIQSHLLQSDNIMVPWGVAHMPGIAREIQKSGFRLDETREYVVIRFRFFGNQGKSTRP
ncbi:MAG: hypothetical protein ABR955_15130, partial [Verrucomicrobiota bacterium]